MPSSNLRPAPRPIKKQVRHRRKTGETAPTITWRNLRAEPKLVMIPGSQRIMKNHLDYHSTLISAVRWSFSSEIERSLLASCQPARSRAVRNSIARLICARREAIDMLDWKTPIPKCLTTNLQGDSAGVVRAASVRVAIWLARRTRANVDRIIGSCESDGLGFATPGPLSSSSQMPFTLSGRTQSAEA